MVTKGGSLYLAGTEGDCEDVEAFQRIIQTHAVNEDDFHTFCALQGGLELRPHGSAYDVYEHADGDVTQIARRVKIPDIPWVPNPLFFLASSPQGRHCLGGLPPAQLQIPRCPAMKTSLQYIGMLDGSDPRFAWMQVAQLPMLFALFECNFGIYLDMADPWAPQVMNPETFDPAWWDASQSGWEQAAYTPIQLSPVDSFAEDVSICGVPVWMQAPEIPVCPKTGETMRFVCQIPSLPSMTMLPGHEGKELPFANDYLCFGDAGYLYIFYHPVSKVMWLAMQF